MTMRRLGIRPIEVPRSAAKPANMLCARAKAANLMYEREFVRNEMKISRSSPIPSIRFSPSRGPPLWKLLITGETKTSRRQRRAPPVMGKFASDRKRERFSPACIRRTAKTMPRSTCQRLSRPLSAAAS